MVTVTQPPEESAPAAAREPLGRWPGWLRVGVPLAIVLVVGGVDYVTGHEILFSTFYLVAVALASWTLGRGFAVLVSVLSVGAWLAGDLASGAVYAHPLVPVWNAVIILAFYLIVVGLLGRLREMQRGLEERVRVRTVALTEEMAERERLEREILDISESERRRIGRDLHDSLGQLLTGTALAGQVLHEKLAARPVAEADDAARIVSLVERAIEETRNLSRGLDPVEIERGGLAQGLRELVAKAGEHSATVCEYHSPGPVAVVDSAVATHLYRITQEAITNALKHGRATHIAVRLEGLPGRVRLTVEDDGVGLRGAAGGGHGMGLRIMAHRAAVMGGTLQVGAASPAGTRVVCEMPNP